MASCVTGHAPGSTGLLLRLCCFETLHLVQWLRLCAYHRLLPPCALQLLAANSQFDVAASACSRSPYRMLNALRTLSSTFFSSSAQVNSSSCSKSLSSGTCRTDAAGPRTRRQHLQHEGQRTADTQRLYEQQAWLRGSRQLCRWAVQDLLSAHNCGTRRVVAVA
jgi:hypothetical protein